MNSSHPATCRLIVSLACARSHWMSGFSVASVDSLREALRVRLRASVPTPSFAQPLTSEPPTSSYLQAAHGGQTAFYGAGEHKRPEQLGSRNRNDGLQGGVSVLKRPCLSIKAPHKPRKRT